VSNRTHAGGRRGHQRQSPPHSPRDAGRTHNGVWIHGMHPAIAALRNPVRKILRVVGTAETVAKLRSDPEIPAALLTNAHTTGRVEIDNLVGAGAVHQGLAVLARPLSSSLADVLDRVEATDRACIVVLDQVTDPHNVGAVLRSAAAFGAVAVLAPDRRAPDESGVMAKSASGALEIIPYIKNINLVRTLEQLKEHRFWLVGLDVAAPKNLADVDLEGRIVLVMGAEGEGLRRLVRETCDHMAKLPMTAAMESLNVSNATVVALYEWTRQTQA